MKYTFLILVFLFNTSITHASDNVQISPNPGKDIENKLISLVGVKDTLETDISTLNSQLDHISIRQKELSQSIEKSFKIQNEIHNTTSNLISIIEQKNNEKHPLAIELIQPPNLYIYILPITTIFIIIASTFLSLRTITIKSQESLSALESSNKTHSNIASSNIAAEQNKSQNSFISNSRQEWINTLRQEISSLLSVIAKMGVTKDEGKIISMSENLWLHFYAVQLLLNPKEFDHQQLITTISDTIQKLLEKDDFHESQREIVSQSKDVLKREWERVKKFE